MELKFIKKQLNEANVDAIVLKRKIQEIAELIEPSIIEKNYTFQLQDKDNSLFILPSQISSKGALSKLIIKYQNENLAITVQNGPLLQNSLKYNQLNIDFDNFKNSFPEIIKELFSKIVNPINLNESLNEDILEKGIEIIKTIQKHKEDKAINKQNIKNLKNIIGDFDIENTVKQYITTNFPQNNLEVVYTEKNGEITLELKCNYAVGISFNQESNTKKIQLNKCATPLGIQDISGKNIDIILQKIGKVLGINFPKINDIVQISNNSVDSEDSDELVSITGNRFKEIENQLGSDVMNILNFEESLNEALATINIPNSICSKYNEAFKIADPTKKYLLVKYFLLKEAGFEEKNIQTTALDTLVKIIQENGGFNYVVNIPLYIILRSKNASERYVNTLYLLKDKDLLRVNKDDENGPLYSFNFIVSGKPEELAKKAQYWYVWLNKDALGKVLPEIHQKIRADNNTYITNAQKITKLIGIESLENIKNGEEFRNLIFKDGNNEYGRSVSELLAIYNAINEFLGVSNKDDDPNEDEKEVKKLNNYKQKKDNENAYKDNDFIASILDYMKKLKGAEKIAFQNAIISLSKKEK